MLAYVTFSSFVREWKSSRHSAVYMYQKLTFRCILPLRSKVTKTKPTALQVFFQIIDSKHPE